MLSGFSSIREVVKSVMTLGSMAQRMVKDMFKNSEKLQYVLSPTMFLHGDKDDICPPSQAKKNFNSCQGCREIFLFKDEGHNIMNVDTYIIDPIIWFANKYNFALGEDPLADEIQWPAFLFLDPQDLQQ